MLMSNYRCVGISLVRKSRGCLLSRFSSFPVGVFFPVVWFGKAVGVFFPVCGLVRKSRGCLLSRPWVSSFPIFFFPGGCLLSRGLVRKSRGCLLSRLWFGSEKPWVSSFPVGVFFPVVWFGKAVGVFFPRCLLSRLFPPSGSQHRVGIRP